MYPLVRRIMHRRSTLFVILVVAASQLLRSYENPQSFTTTARPVLVAMRNVEYHYAPDISVRILFLHGELYPTRPPQIVVFDDKQSFFLVMAYSQISMSCD